MRRTGCLVGWALALSMWCQRTHSAAGRSAESSEVDMQTQLAAILDKLHSLDERVTSLDDGVDELRGQVGLLLHPASADGIDQVLRDLQGVCQGLKSSVSDGQQSVARTSLSCDHVTTTTPGQLAQTPVNHTCPTPSGSSQFQVAQVLKTETETTYIITVCYQGSSKPMVVERTSLMGPSVPLEHAELGVVRLHLDKSHMDQPPYLRLAFILPDMAVTLVFQLEENSPDDVRLPTVQTTVRPGSDVIYRSGDDVDIELDINTEDERAMIDFQYLHTRVLLKSNTEDHVVDELWLVPNGGLPEQIPGLFFNQSTIDDRIQGTFIRIPSSPDKWKGVVVFFLVSSVNCSEGCLVSGVYVSTVVTFYPADRAPGPFPAHFVGFVRDPEDHHWDQFRCSTTSSYRQCTLVCSVAGDHPTVSMARGTGEGEASPYSYASYGHSLAPYYVSGRLTFHNVTTQDAGKYVCTARAGKRGPPITHTLVLTVEDD